MLRIRLSPFTFLLATLGVCATFVSACSDSTDPVAVPDGGTSADGGNTDATPTGDSSTTSDAKADATESDAEPPSDAGNDGS